MKILYFSRSYTPHDFRFLSAIVQGGHKAFFLRLKNGKASEKRPLPKGVKQVSGSLKTVILKIKPDLLHAGPLTDCGYQAARSGFHPLVLMSWGSDILWEARKNKISRRRVRYALAHADALNADCQAVEEAATKYRFPKKRIVIFPWGVDLSRFYPNKASGTLRKKYGWQDKFVLLHLRTLDPLYDPLTVVRAFVHAARENTRLRLLIAGSGILKTKLVNIIRRAGMIDRVKFPGQISQYELPAYFRSSDLYLSAAQSDGSSVSLIEALACGLPALVSDIPGNREWVRSGKQGWLFPVGDELALAKMILVAERSNRLKQMAQKSRRSAEKKANWAKNKQLLFQAYKIALESNS